MNRFLNLTKKALQLFSPFPKASTDQNQWKEQAQTGEFNYHKKDSWRSSPQFKSDVAARLGYFGFSETDFQGKTIVDVGAGSRLMTTFFKDAEIYVIEPLAEQYLQEITWSDLKCAKKVFSTPAEQFIPELENTADFIFSVNAIDHCFEFEKIIGNLYKYAKKDARLFLSFDRHYFTDEMHPLKLTKKLCDTIFTKHGFKIEKHTTGLNNRKGYGQLHKALNYWLRK